MKDEVSHPLRAVLTGVKARKKLRDFLGFALTLRTAYLCLFSQVKAT